MTAKLPDFISLEREFTFWIPTRTEAVIKKGDQFRAYLDSLKPFEKYYIDFNQRLDSIQTFESNEDQVNDEKEGKDDSESQE